MTTIKTKDLTGAALDWAVMKCEHPRNNSIAFFLELRNEHVLLNGRTGRFRYSTEWAQGGPIIERNLIVINPVPEGGWIARSFGDATEHAGRRALVAAMRCYVANELGHEVDIPEPLLNVDAQ